MKRVKHPIYTWEYNERPPISDLIQEARQYPKHRLYVSMPHGSTFTEMAFARSASEAKRRLMTKNVEVFA